MEEFTVRDVRLQVPEAFLSTTLKDNLLRGHYEVSESAAVDRHLQPGQRVLELGSGCGYMAVRMARIAGAENISTVEANPDMLDVIRNNFSLNNVDGIRLIHGAAVGDAEGAETVRFKQSQAFWASAVGKKGQGGQGMIDVPALPLSSLLQEIRPHFLIADVEGAETDYFGQEVNDELQSIVIELHPNRYSPRRMNAIFKRLFRQGFAYQPYGTKGAVVCFERF